jgi:hypothetical protein
MAAAAAGAAAGAGWELPWWVTATAEVVAATVCWLALCRLAAWRRRRTRVAPAGAPPDPPKGSRKPVPVEVANPRVKKGGHGGARLDGRLT